MNQKLSSGDIMIATGDCRVIKNFVIKFWFVITVLIFVNLTILLNIPFLRQIFGFIFLTYLPGLLLLHILKLNRIELVEKFVLSVGLSISFLIFFGLFINTLFPLSTIPLLISFNLVFVILAIIGYKINKNPVFSFPAFNLNLSEKVFLIPPILFPVLSVFGTHIMNTTDNNIILIFLLTLIPIYIIGVCLAHNFFPKRLYSSIIFLISISLLLIFSLRSNHIIIGTDTGREFYLFQVTMNNLHWKPLGNTILDACLSISLLPTLYQSLLNTNAEYLFKVLPALIFSNLPVVVYIFSKKYLGHFYAFLASFFSISQIVFLWAPSIIRVNFGILFFMLSIMVLFNDKIDSFNRQLLFIIFTISVVVSHYSTTYIYFIILVLTFLGTKILEIISSNPELENKKNVTFGSIALFFAVIFFWYAQIIETAWTNGVNFIKNVIVSLNEFFILESRTGEIPKLLAIGIENDIPHYIELIFTWSLFILIGIGVISIMYRYIKAKEISIAISKSVKRQLEKEYLTMVIVSCGLLLMAVGLPKISLGYDLTRLFFQLTIILSVPFILGAFTLSSFLNSVFARSISYIKLHIMKKNYKSTLHPFMNCKNIQPFMIILTVLIGYFLSISGVTYQLADIPKHVTLNSEGIEYNRRVIHDQEVYAANWMAKYVPQDEKIFTDCKGFNVLHGLGKIPEPRINNYLISYYDDKEHEINGIIYLDYYPVNSGKIIVRYPVEGIKEREVDIDKYRYIFIRRAKIYANNGSEIYK